MFTRWKQQQRKEKLAAKKKLKKEREALGDKAPPKPVPKTIDNQRVYDETLILEAMKMETEIRAAQAGTVRGIAVKAGDAVAVGDTLMTLA
ncbi:hypothetical protein E3AUHO_50740 [Klebsiella pneumoniae subsp. pneumoniae]|nr:hypothetical protein E3AUHO_50740 [Klebsiella pneumoniae subsp. pneumoniae]